MGFKGVGDPPGSARVAPSALMFLQVGITPTQLGRLYQMWSPPYSPKEFAGCLLTKALVK